MSAVSVAFGRAIGGAADHRPNLMILMVNHVVEPIVISPDDITEISGIIQGQRSADLVEFAVDPPFLVFILGPVRFQAARPGAGGFEIGHIDDLCGAPLGADEHLVVVGDRANERNQPERLDAVSKVGVWRAPALLSCCIYCSPKQLSARRIKPSIRDQRV